MKRFAITFCTILFCGCYYQSFGQTDAQAQAQQKAWMEYMTPGAMHQMLAKDNGEWKTEMTMWMAPGAPPTKATGKVVNEMILGGRYQQSKFTGDFMGMPMEGMGTVGYDNAKKILVSTWQDNMGTGIMYMEGKYDPATKSAVLRGKAVDPMTGKDVQVRQVMKWIDDKNQLMEMYITQDGKEFKNMELKFTR